MQTSPDDVMALRINTERQFPLPPVAYSVQYITYWAQFPIYHKTDWAVPAIYLRTDYLPVL